MEGLEATYEPDARVRYGRTARTRPTQQPTEGGESGQELHLPSGEGPCIVPRDVIALYYGLRDMLHR